MAIYDEIRETLQREWRSGVTQQKIADRAQVSNPYINNLLSGKRKVGSMKLETLFKLFPRVEINLNGHRQGAPAVASAEGRNAAEIESALMKKILEDETLTDQEKVKFLKILRK